ncbi:MAG TPA: VWA domain-containing protein [Acidobacteriaceae bacterium]|jgi:VWFA-related protein|nr:VWA domain-containing protein [Acidobacteriaceae bacterium]
MIERSLLALVLISLATSLDAQRSPVAPVLPPPPAQQKGPSVLDVVVTDKAGHPISGLQQGDFTLLDDGQPTPILSFKATDAAPEPTQVILLIDEVNTSFTAVSTERTQLDKLLTANGGRLPFPFTVIFLTDTGMTQVNQPTTDGMALDAQFRKQESTLRDLRRSAGFYGASDQMGISLKALGSLAQTLGPVPGKKLVVWMSPGWWLFNSPGVYISDRMHRTYFGAIVDLNKSLERARVVLYAVNPLGASDAGSMHNFEWRDFTRPVRDANHAQPGDLALQALAQTSGGQVLFGSNDIAAEVAQCVADGSSSYRLTFDTEHADAPNTWHSLQLRMDKPALKPRTRDGYYAEP